MPGDPLRARYIAERFLESPREVTAVRNMYGFTGTFRGKRLSVMGHGMGIPSLSIYATELVTEYGVRVLIRVGSCGAIRKDVPMRSVIVATGAGTDSKVNRMRMLDHDFPAVADFALARRAVEAAERLGRTVRVGSVFSTDFFYHPQKNLLDVLERMGMLAVEMEVAGPLRRGGGVRRPGARAAHRVGSDPPERAPHAHRPADVLRRDDRGGPGGRRRGARREPLRAQLEGSSCAGSLPA